MSGDDGRGRETTGEGERGRETTGEGGRRRTTRREESGLAPSEGSLASTPDGKQAIITSVNRMPTAGIIANTCWLSSSHTQAGWSLLWPPPPPPPPPPHSCLFGRGEKISEPLP